MRPCPPTQSVGLIGIGLMGQAFAERLIAAGLAVVGYDVDPARTAHLAALGGQPAASIAEAAQRCEAILLAVFSTDQVEQVVEEGILPAVGESSGKVVMCASTCDPDRIAALGARVAKRGLAFLETPVSGTSEQVRRGQGVGLIGGDAEIAARSGAGARRPVPELRPCRRHRRWRTRQARHQSDPRPQPAGARRRPGVRRAPRPRPQGVPADRARLGRLLRRSWTPRGRKCWRATSRPKAACARPSRMRGSCSTRRGAAASGCRCSEVHADVLEACVRAGDGDRDNSIVIAEIARRRQEI